MFLYRDPATYAAAFDSPLQTEFRSNSDGTRYMCVRLYNNVGTALVVGRTYAVEVSGAEASPWQVITPVALAVYQYVVVALEATAIGAYGWFAIQGFVDALVEGTTDVADLDYLDVTPATIATAFIKDHSTIRSTASVARACAAQTSATPTLTRVQLIGDPVLIP